MVAVPLLDFSHRRLRPAAFARDLCRACQTVGTFQLIHRLPLSSPKNTLSAARQFFDLADEAKLAIDYCRSPSFRGFMSLGSENTQGVTDLREQIEFGPEQAAPPLRTHPSYLRLAGPNQYPSPHLVPHFRPSIDQYVVDMLSVATALTESLAHGLGIPPKAISQLLGPSPHWQMKLARYWHAAAATSARPSPTPRGGAAKAASQATTVGVGAHTDSGFLTMVLQGGPAEGLQIHHDGEWLAIPSTDPDILIVTLGEVAQLATGGVCRATRHRVLPPSSASADRISVPFFFNPSLTSVIQPLPMRTAAPPAQRLSRPPADWYNVDSGGLGWPLPMHTPRPTHAPPAAGPESVGGAESGAAKSSTNALLTCFGENAFKSLARSHPQVFREHHPDLAQLADGRIVTRRAVALSPPH